MRRYPDANLLRGIVFCPDCPNPWGIGATHLSRLIHELAHLIESNHTSEFWSIVSDQTPSIERARTWLRENRQILEEDIIEQRIALCITTGSSGRSAKISHSLFRPRAGLAPQTTWRGPHIVVA
ncbi:MAG: M48 family metallopeptidase [Planctomycetota bacterium]